MQFWGNFWGSGGPVYGGWEWLSGTNIAIFALLIAWSMIWKGIALWKSARAGSKIWFVVLLVVNTVGILEILYIYVFSKKAQPVQQGQE